MANTKKTTVTPIRGGTRVRKFENGYLKEIKDVRRDTKGGTTVTKTKYWSWISTLTPPSRCDGGFFTYINMISFIEAVERKACRYCEMPMADDKKQTFNYGKEYAHTRCFDTHQRQQDCMLAKAKGVALVSFQKRKSGPPIFKNQQNKVLLDFSTANDAFYAGSPLVSVCEHCGWPTAILDEEYHIVKLSVPKVCILCQDLIEMGWMPKWPQTGTHTLHFFSFASKAIFGIMAQCNGKSYQLSFWLLFAVVLQKQQPQRLTGLFDLRSHNPLSSIWLCHTLQTNVLSACSWLNSKRSIT